MNEYEIKESIEELIIQDKIDKAFSILKNWVHDNEIHKTFINLWRRYNQNENDFNKFKISYEDYSTFKSRITFSLIELVSETFSLQVDANRKATNFMKLGAAQMEIFNFSKAKGYFEKVISLVPNHIQAHMERGVAEMNLSNFDQAIVEFNKVIMLEPDNPFALNNRGVAFFQVGKSKEACNDWRKVKDLEFDISDFAIKNHCS